MVIWENSRCSIRFHFEVPGGSWRTVTVRPVSAAKVASSIFQARTVGSAAVGADEEPVGVG